MLPILDTEKIQSPPIRRDKEIELKKIEAEMVNKVISEEDLKTQYSQKERILITLLEKISDKPFSISERIAKDKGIAFDMKRYQFPLLKETVLGYSRKGKALNRQGIGEDVKIVSAYFQAQIEQAQAEKRQSKVMK